MSFGFRYGSSAGGRCNRFWQDIYLNSSGYDMQITDWEGGCRAATVNFVECTLWQLGWYGWERQSQRWWWQSKVVSNAKTEICDPLLVRDPDNSCFGSSSTYIRLSTNPWGHNAQSRRDDSECHLWDDLRDWVQAFDLIGCRTFEFSLLESEHLHLPARAQMQYPPYNICCLDTHERNHQATAISHTVHAVAGFYKSLSSH